MRVIKLEPSFDIGSLKKLVKQELTEALSKQEPQISTQIPIETLKKLHQEGWLQSYIPTQFGGLGLPTADLLFLARELAYGSASVFSIFSASMVGHLATILYGNETLSRALCAETLAHFSAWSLCFTEPNSGSDLRQITTRAERTADGYCINGQKCFISNATFSKFLTVFATLNCGNKERLTAFFVPANTPGISRGKPLRLLGQNHSDTCELFFDQVLIPKMHLIGREGEGETVLKHCIQRSKILIAGAGVGVCIRAMDLLKENLGQRIRYGQPLLSLPVIQSQLAQLQTRVEAAWLLACSAAEVWDSGNFAIKEASMAKMFSADASVAFVNEALELFGAYGYSQEYEIERLYRDVKLFEIYEGASLVQATVIAKELFKKDLEESNHAIRLRKSA